MKLNNINKPTAAKWVKLGTSLIAVGTSVAGYSLTQEIQFVGYFGLACIAVGTFIITFNE